MVSSLPVVVASIARRTVGSIGSAQRTGVVIGRQSQKSAFSTQLSTASSHSNSPINSFVQAWYNTYV